MTESSVLPFSDIHTHRTDAGRDAVICIDPSVDPLPAIQPGWHYSVGIHPWRADCATDRVWRLLDELSRRPEVVAIGEAGLDTLRGPSPEVQLPVFVRQAQLAEAVGKPLIIHAVRSWADIMALRRQMRPAQPWIIHGFRGKPQLAAQLVRAGFHISLGKLHHPGVPLVVPPDRLHRESDDM